MVWDRLSTHISKTMKALVAERDWLTVVLLPGYAPDLNPVEGLWAHIKRSLANLAARTLGELETLLRSRLKALQYRHGVLGGFLTGTGLALDRRDGPKHAEVSNARRRHRRAPSGMTPSIPCHSSAAPGRRPDRSGCGSVHDTAAEVVAAVFDQATRRGPAHRWPWVILVDGARHQIDLIKAEADKRGADIHIIVDLIHVLEYLWRAAWCLHDSGDASAETWVARQARTLLAGGVQQTAAALDAVARTARLRGAKRKGIDETVNYLTDKGEHLRYGTALERGWPIATGIIKGACCHLVKDRLDITGARWGLAGAEAVLKLRAVRANGDFEAYWA